MTTHRILIRGLAALALAGTAQSGPADTYVVDGAHSHVGFSIRHLVSRVPGGFTSFEGEFTFDPANPEKSSGSFTVDAASISTGNAKRDGHLKSEDFFDVAKYPAITLDKVKLKSAKGKGRYVLEGVLAMHGEKRKVSFDVEHLGSMGDVAGFTATGTVNRKDFGIVWNKVLDGGSLLLGDEVQITISVEAKKK